MENLTPEQLAEYEKWLKENPEPKISEEVIKGIIADDIKETEERNSKRLQHSREYNSKYIPAVKTSVQEEALAGQEEPEFKPEGKYDRKDYFKLRATKGLPGMIQEILKEKNLDINNLTGPEVLAAIENYVKELERQWRKNEEI